MEAVPEQFLVGMVKEQKALQENKKWAVVEALGGVSNAALIINDRTEKLEQYLRVKDSKFGKLIFIVSLLRCWFRYHVEAGREDGVLIFLEVVVSEY